MSIEDALVDVDIAFRQLEFTIKLLSFCELGHINPSDFDTDHLVMLEGGNPKTAALKSKVRTPVEFRCGLSRATRSLSNVFRYQVNLESEFEG